MVDPDLGLAVVFNGCIYNYRALRSELSAAGYRFFSASDTEVLLKAYDYWREGFATRLNGMFAAAIAELSTGDVVLVRDGMGIKPLYVAQVSGATRFSSTLPSLLAGGGVDTSLDPVALYHYLTFHSMVPSPRTILAGVRRVKPGTLVRLSASGRVQESCYCQSPFLERRSRGEMCAQDWQTSVRNLLRAAVKRQIVADVPIGVLLSGGLDSSLVVALLAEVTGRAVPTFSIGFESTDAVAGDEFEFSDVVARHFNTDHHRLLVSNAELVPALERAVSAMGEPMASHDAVAFHLLFQEVGRHVKVVQSGQGADELFAGYGRHQRFHPRTGNGLAAYVSLFDRTHTEISASLRPAYRLKTDPGLEFISPYFAPRAGATALDHVLHFATEVTLVDDPLKRVDSMGMASGVETRVPYLDHDLVRVAVACPPELKLAQGGKGVLKDAARQLLPDSIVDRSKGSFPVPAVMAIKGAVADLVRDALEAPASRVRGIFRGDYVDRLIAAPEHTPLGDSKLWQIAVLELWLQTHGL